MNRVFTCIVLLFSCITAYPQITAVDTACPNVNLSYTAPANGISYTWVSDTVNVNQSAGPFTTAGLSIETKATFASTVNDSGTWYTFITYHQSNTLRRLTYSGGPNGSYTTTTVGTYGTTGQLEGIDIVKDQATGNWYGLAANSHLLFVLSFGTSLANAPSTNTYNFTGTMSWPHQVGLAKYGNNWIGFIGDRNSTIKRVDFGTSMTNTPTMTTIPNVGSVSQPCNFAIHKEGNNWYMLVPSLIAGTVTRYNFGTNISNNAPTGTLLSAGNLFNIPRSVCIIPDCDQLIAIVMNESGPLIKLNFGQTITNNSPTATNMGSTGISQQNSLNTYLVDSAMYANIVSFGFTSLSRGKLISFPFSDTTKFYNNTHNWSYAIGGSKNMTLYMNMGSHMGSEVYCKPQFIRPGIYMTDTTACSADSLLLDASLSGATGYTWSTGATTPTIKVDTTGKYWVSLTGPSCSPSDTVDVTITPTPTVSLGADTAFCDTMQFLANQFVNPIGLTHLWSTGSSDTAIRIDTTGTYWLEVINNGCAGSDTIDVDVTDLWPLSLGNDTAICAGNSVVLKNLDTASPGVTYLWSNGSSTPQITGTSGAYWLQATLNGCETADTINIIQKPIPMVALGNDTAVCDTTHMLTNLFTNPAGSSLLWSTGSTDTTIIADTTNNYWLQVTKDGCIGTDTITVSVTKLYEPFLGNDTSICADKSVPLSNMNTAMPGVTYLWNTGSTNPQINATSGTYWLNITSGACEAADTINIVQHPLPVVVLSNDTFLCIGDELTLRGNGQPTGTTYQWSTGSKADTITVIYKGTYTLNVTDTNGCAASDKIEIDELIPPSVTLGNFREICKGDSLKLPLDIHANIPYTIQWQDGRTDTTYIAKETGTYTVAISDVCGTVYDEVDLNFFHCKIFFPSAFSPNGDGRNDVAKITGDVAGILQYELSIYNRRGQRVFHTTNPYDGWDGNFNGKESGVDSYYYMIKINYRGQRDLLKGDIVLMK